MSQLSTIQNENALTKPPLKQIAGKQIEEAPLYFANGAQDIDQKRGLSIHGPSDAKKDVLFTIRIGIVSTGKGIQDTTDCLLRLNQDKIQSSLNRPFTTQSFPGFENAFHCRLVMSSDYNDEIVTKEVERLLRIRIPERRIKRAAELYAERVGNICRRVSVPDVIICHEPERIEAECGAGMVGTRRESTLTPADRKEAANIRKLVETHKILAPLDESTKNLLDMAVHQDFRRVLKAKGLSYDVPTQILTQTVLELLLPTEISQKQPPRGQDPSTHAWNLAAAIYYKANHFPWRVGNLRSGTCYVGIAFYLDQTTSEKHMCASLAQIFSDTCEGLIVRGNSFKWDTKKRGHPHLAEQDAFKILSDAIKIYKKHHNDQNPNRVVLHKTSGYLEAELKGFRETCKHVPKFDFVSISDGRDVFFYRNGEKAVLRGTCLQLGNSSMIYTKGYVPYQRAYLGPRVPRPLELTEHYGDSSLDEVATEMIALSRLDWNTTDYCCYWPMTLKCARRVGDILGLIPQGEIVKEQYRFYM